MLSVKTLHDCPMANQSAFYMLDGMYINNIVKLNDGEYQMLFANGKQKIYTPNTQVKVVGS